MHPRLSPSPLAAALLAAAFLSAACGSDGITLPDERAAAAIEITAGDDQTGTVGSALPEPVTALVTDAEGRPVVDQRVEFSVSGNGSAAPIAVQTNASGVAATQWVLGTAAGSQTLTARPVGNGAATVSASAEATATAAAPASLAMVSGDGQSGVAGTTLANPLVVEVEDEFGNPVEGVSVSWSISGGGSVSEEVTTTDANGRAGVTRTLGTSTGAQGTAAASDGLEGSPVEFAATATVGSAGRLAIERQPSATAQSGAAFSQQPQIQLQDASGNDVAQAGIAVEAALASGPSGATLVGTTIAATNGAGVASFTNLGISGPAGQYTLNFSGSNLSLTGVTSGTITIAAGAATALRFAVQPSNTVAGSPIAPPVQVELVDAQGNLVTTSDRTVNLTLQGGTGGTLSGTTSVTTSGGVATFSNLMISQAGSNYRLVAGASGVSGATSTTFSVSTGSASRLAFVTQPSSTGAGAAISPAVTVEVEDANGNRVSGFGGPITMTIASGPSGAVLSGTTTVDAVGGLATFTDLSLDRAGTYTLRASSTGLTGATSASFSVSAAAATEILKIAGDNQSALVGTAVPTDPRVRVVDGSGNGVGGVTVTFAVASGGGSVTGASPTTNSAGEAQVGSWILGSSAGTNTLTASVSGLTPATFTATAQAGSGSALDFVQGSEPPSSIASGGLMSTTVVQIVDAQGNPVSTSGVPITISISGSAQLGGTLTRNTDGNGRATFTGVTVSGTAGAYTLSFSGQGTPLTAPIEITPGAVSAAQSSVVISPGTVEAGAAATVTVTARDAVGNAVAGAGVALTVSPGTANFDDASLTTDGDGQAQTGFTSTVIGDYTVSATITGPIGGPVTEDGAVTVTAASTTTSILGATPDPSETGQLVTVQWSVTSAALANPVGTVDVTTDEGTSCSALTSAGSCTLTFGSAGNWLITATFAPQGSWAGSSSAAEPHTVTAPPPEGGAVSVEIRRQPSSIAESGAVFREQPEVRVRGPDGENLSGVAVDVSLERGTGVLGGRTSDRTRPNGVASWDDLRITGSGEHVLRFTAGTTIALSTPIDVVP